MGGGGMSPISEARRRANEKYNAKAYEEIKVRVVKGQKEIIQAHAEAHGQSVNGFINSAIDEKMEQDRAGGPQEAAGGPSGSGVVSLPSETSEGVPGTSEGRTEGKAEEGRN